MAYILAVISSNPSLVLRRWSFPDHYSLSLASNFVSFLYPHKMRLTFLPLDLTIISFSNPIILVGLEYCVGWTVLLKWLQITVQWLLEKNQIIFHVWIGFGRTGVKAFKSWILIWKRTVPDISKFQPTIFAKHSFVSPKAGSWRKLSCSNFPIRKKPACF